GAASAPKGQDLRRRLAAAEGPGRRGETPRGAIPHRDQASHRLLGVPPMRPAVRSALSDIDRRTALKLLASGAPLALGACGRPPEQVVPYVEMPERLTPGIPLRFASALALGGFARGVIVTSAEGRPIKVDGNPRHPASLGATDIFAEAAIMSLADPDRLKTVRRGEEIAAWSAFEAALLAQMEQERARHGAGLRILTNRITSPTLLRQIDG